MRPYQYIGILFTVIFITVIVLFVMDIIPYDWIIISGLGYLIFLYFCVTQIRWNYYIKSYNKGYKPGMIALTFDDGPNRETEEILDILKKEKVQAAFFCIGKNVAVNPLLIMRMHDEGHVVGNHSHYHTRHFDWMNSEKMLEEIEQCNSAIQQITGNKPHLLRPPYGITNPNLARAVKRSGMASIGWSLRSFDTMTRNRGKLKRRIINKLKSGDIVLLHDSMPITREILTDLIREGREKGFTFVRIDQLLDIQAYA